MRDRRFYYFVSIVGLIVGLWGMLDQARLSRLPREFPIEEVRFPATVNGVATGSAPELRFRIQSLPENTIADIRSGGIERRATLVRQLTTFQSLVSLIGGLFFLAVNIVVFCARVDRGPVRDFYWATLMFGIAILIGGVYAPGASVWPHALKSLIWIICLALLPVLFAHLTLTFPRRWKLPDRAPFFIPAVAAIAIGLIVWQSAAYLRYFYNPGPATWNAVQWPKALAQLYLVAGVSFGCAILLIGSRRLELTQERVQTKWLLWGFTLGVTPYVFLRTLPRLFGIESPIPREVDRIFELAIPVAFVFSVVRHKFLDIDIIIRRSLIYSFLAGFMGLIYVVLVMLVGRLVRSQFPAAAPYIPLGAAVIPVALFSPTRRAIGGWVDRTFFKISYNHTQALRSLKRTLPSIPGQQELADSVCELLVGCLRPKRAVVVLQSGAERCISDTRPDARFHMSNAAEADLVERVFRDGAKRPVALPGSTSLPEIESADFPDALRAQDERIAVPIVIAERPRGWILLGEKSSERRYIEQDIDLLEGVAAETAIALERITLVQRVATEAHERIRLDEIDRLKSDFLSRVSHDLRTPITSILWSTNNLLDGIIGEMSERQRSYVDSIQASAGQMQRLVNNLLEISRLETATVRVNIERVDLAEVVDEAVRSLAPIAARRDVKLVSQIAPELSPVRGDREKLHEIAANLIENAIKYSPNASAVEIDVNDNGAGSIELVVRDHGPGVREDEREVIFERFKQGRPSPYAEGGGFGLGLYVVRSFLMLMDATVSVDNHPGGGARFTCRIPAAHQRGGER